MIKCVGKVDIGGIGKSPALPSAPFGKPGLASIAKKPTVVAKMDLGALGKKTAFGKKGFGAFGKKPSSAKEGEADGLLEGISSLHSWIKSQTMMKPSVKLRGSKMENAYDVVSRSWNLKPITLFSPYYN